MAASTATPTLHKCIEKGIRKTILASSKTPIQSCLAEHGLSDRLSRASDAELERYDKLGQLGLYICFIHTLFLEPVGERPVGHFKAVQDRVLSRETLALVMQNADVDCTSTNTNVLVEALQIFVGALFRKKDLTTVLFWFRGVFLPIVAAADTAYVNWHSRNKVAPHDTAKDISKQGHLEPTKRFGQAQTLLTTQRTVKDSLPPPVDAPRKPDVVGVAPSSQTELETRTFTGAVREAIVAATAVVKQEFGDFSNAAFPLGFLTFMAEAPTAFVTGLASALGTDASNNRKRKLISDSTESDVASASTSASASASVSVSASATSTSADPLPPPRKKCHPPSVRARVPLAASTADALSPPRKTRNPPFMRARAPSPPSPHRYKQRKASQFTENLPVKPHIHYYPRRPLVAIQPATHTFSASRPPGSHALKPVPPQYGPLPRTLLPSTKIGRIPAAPLLPSITFLFSHRT